MSLNPKYIFQVFPKRNEWRAGSELVDFHFDVGVYSGVFQKSLSSLQVDWDPIRDQSGCAGKTFWCFSTIFGNFWEGSPLFNIYPYTYLQKALLAI